MSTDNFDPPSHWTNNRRFFFKYVNRTTGKIVLENRTLRWSTPGTLNDPYDMQFDLHMEVDHEVVKALVLQKLWDGFYGGQIVPADNRLGAIIKWYETHFLGLHAKNSTGNSARPLTIA
jgi:hypothetical protein